MSTFFTRRRPGVAVVIEKEAEKYTNCFSKHYKAKDYSTKPTFCVFLTLALVFLWANSRVGYAFLTICSSSRKFWLISYQRLDHIAANFAALAYDKCRDFPMF